ncbi:MAG: SMC-Scp complex subunit ScpB [Planctomycetaceae bacterium]|nr:SMC-Scp complex subunit ScpB [Planctomycetaceae bacterium]
MTEDDSLIPPANPADDQLDDMELAYRQALEAIDEAERRVGEVMIDFVDDSSSDPDETEPASAFSVGEQLAEDLSRTEAETQDTSEDLVHGIRRVSPRQVIEAAVFVGGDVSLTGRRLASLIGQDVDARVAVSLIDNLNQKYNRENRPYEIRLHEGGYRLELRDEFRDVAMRTFGLGPREVKLSPDTLEVLATVAYNQPVTKEDLADIDRPNTMTLLRQLIRLQLVELHRTGSGRQDVAYQTTERFLRLFGLKSIADLPTADIFSFK